MTKTEKIILRKLRDSLYGDILKARATYEANATETNKRKLINANGKYTGVCMAMVELGVDEIEEE